MFAVDIDLQAVPRGYAQPGMPGALGDVESAAKIKMLVLGMRPREGAPVAGNEILGRGWNRIEVPGQVANDGTKSNYNAQANRPAAHLQAPQPFLPAIIDNFGEHEGLDRIEVPFPGLFEGSCLKESVA